MEPEVRTELGVPGEPAPGEPMEPEVRTEPVVPMELGKAGEPEPGETTATMKTGSARSAGSRSC